LKLKHKNWVDRWILGGPIGTLLGILYLVRCAIHGFDEDIDHE